jgi:hypothetical protein
VAAVGALIRNGITASFLPDDRKRSLLVEVDAVIAGHTGRRVRRSAGVDTP